MRKWQNLEVSRNSEATVILRNFLQTQDPTLAEGTLNELVQVLKARFETSSEINRDRITDIKRLQFQLAQFVSVHLIEKVCRDEVMIDILSEFVRQNISVNEIIEAITREDKKQFMENIPPLIIQNAEITEDESNSMYKTMLNINDANINRDTSKVQSNIINRTTQTPVIVGGRGQSTPFSNQRTNILCITKESIHSRGKTPLIFRDITLYFHLVPDDFPIDEDGLIGSEMLSRYKAKINYEENLLEIASHVINLRSINNVNCLRPVNNGSVNLTQAERCTETQGMMWRDDRNCANARNSNATTIKEKSSIVSGECSSLNVYSNLHVSHENAIPNNCLVPCTSVTQSKNNTEQTPSKIDPKIENTNNKILKLKIEKLRN